MATIIVNGCFDILHQGHIAFLQAAKSLGGYPSQNQLIVFVNNDASARRLKRERWGENYPIDDIYTRVMNLRHYADEVFMFDHEDQLLAGINAWMPCVLCKGPDYIAKDVTGDEIAPVIILNTPEPSGVREMKIRRYSGLPAKV